MLEQTDAITIDNKIPQAGTASPSCELIINGKKTGRRLHGYCLESAIICDDGYLVFLSHGCPFEETLSIYFVDLLGDKQDSAHIGGMYTTGTFRNIKIRQPNQMQFDFFAESTLTIKILPSSEFRMPFFSEPLGIHRSFGFRRRFVISETRHVKKRYPIVDIMLKIIHTLRPAKTK